MHDLKVRCGKMVEADRLLDCLHEDLRQIITIDVKESEETEVDVDVETAVAEVSEPEPAPAPSKATAPAQKPAAAPAGKVPASVLDRLQKKPAQEVEKTSPVAEAIQEAITEGDGDGLLDGTDSKKK
jgi:hypothetical protein